MRFFYLPDLAAFFKINFHQVVFSSMIYYDTLLFVLQYSLYKTWLSFLNDVPALYSTK